ncbi:hypothetical protein BKA66DRAFT_443147 [Pyrenochaeta sp. MPI-SDFR-AT-0127]|nr:hypothetical protein BKA66DRAFT_443147 [Pyrenochaeta sp. MPI-SDFR-AT-0127]
MLETVQGFLHEAIKQFAGGAKNSAQSAVRTIEHYLRLDIKMALQGTQRIAEDIANRFERELRDLLIVFAALRESKAGDYDIVAYRLGVELTTTLVGRMCMVLCCNIIAIYEFLDLGLAKKIATVFQLAFVGLIGYGVLYLLMWVIFQLSQISTFSFWWDGAFFEVVVL